MVIAVGIWMSKLTQYFNSRVTENQYCLGEKSLLLTGGGLSSHSSRGCVRVLKITRGALLYKGACRRQHIELLTMVYYNTKTQSKASKKGNTEGSLEETRYCQLPLGVLYNMLSSPSCETHMKLFTCLIKTLCPGTSVKLVCLSIFCTTHNKILDAQKESRVQHEQY